MKSSEYVSIFSIDGNISAYFRATLQTPFCISPCIVHAHVTALTYEKSCSHVKSL